MGLRGTTEVDDYLPDLLKGDLDSVREDVRRYYETRVSFRKRFPPKLLPVARGGVFIAHSSLFYSKGVPVVRDDDQYSTDLMKCLHSLQEKEEADGVDVGGLLHPESRRIIGLFFLFFSPPLLSRFDSRHLTTSCCLVA